MPTEVTNTVPELPMMMVGSRRTAQRSSSRTRTDSGHGSIISHRNQRGMPRDGGTGAAWTARISAWMSCTVLRFAFAMTWPISERPCSIIMPTCTSSNTSSRLRPLR